MSLVQMYLAIYSYTKNYLKRRPIYCSETRSSSVRTLKSSNNTAIRGSTLFCKTHLVYSDRVEVGRKLREMRQARRLSQGDIEKKVGLLRCYTSRIENGMTIPSIKTLEKFAYALEIPLYR